MKYGLLYLALFLSACATLPDPNTTAGPETVKVSADDKHASESGIAGAPGGGLFVVWSERNAQKKYDVFVREYDAGLTPRSGPVRVNPNAGEARTWYGDAPSILIAPDGKIYVAWNRTYSDGSAGNDLMLSTSTDGGKTFGDPLKINDDTSPASHGMHGMTLDSRGRVLISWLDERYLKRSQARSGVNVGGPLFALFFHHTPTPETKESDSEEPDAELYFAVVEDGRLEGPNRKIGSEICPCCRVAVESAPDGTIYVAFRKVWPGQFRHISLVHSSDGGATFSEPVQVSDDQWKLFACPVTGAALRATERNELEIVWYSGGNRAEKGLYRAVSADRGITFSAPILISQTAVKGSPDIVGDSLVFGSPERVFVSNADAERRLADGSNPSAVAADGKIITALTKMSGDSSSIWLVK